jgi:hypothetical protein
LLGRERLAVTVLISSPGMIAPVPGRVRPAVGRNAMIFGAGGLVEDVEALKF